MGLVILVQQLVSSVVYVLPIWILGALFGLLLPREQVVQRVGGVVRAVVAVGKMVLFGIKTHDIQRQESVTVQDQKSSGVVELADEQIDDINWYIKRSDFEFFLSRAAYDGEDCRGWKPLMKKYVPGQIDYWAKQRRQANGKTEYVSGSIIANVAAQEAMDFYLYDTLRPKWDGMIKHVEVLEQGDHDKRCQVVRWLRSFPFAFLNDREYVIARRRFIDKDGVFYGITKTVDHPNAPPRGKTVRMQSFFSMWKIRNVANPWNPNQEAVEIVLLHFEDFGIPENLSRLAVKIGMWGFVKSMIPALQQYAQERRMRVPPNDEDPAAFGVGITPGPIVQNRGMLGASISTNSLRSMDSLDSTGSKRQTNLKRVTSAVLIAGGVAVASNIVQKFDGQQNRTPTKQHSKKSYNKSKSQQNK